MNKTIPIWCQLLLVLGLEGLSAISLVENVYLAMLLCKVLSHWLSPWRSVEGSSGNLFLIEN